MVFERSPNDEHDNNLYCRYKAFESQAFGSLFPNQPYREWTLRKFGSNAKDVIASLGPEKRKTIIDQLERSTEARERYSLRFRYAPKESQLRHAGFVELVKGIIALLKAVGSKSKAPTDVIPQQGQALGEDKSMDEVSFLRFLEEIEMLVGDAVLTWSRAGAGEIRLSTASTLASTYVCKLIHMINAERNILNPSWFEPDGRVKIHLSHCSPYWDELRSTAQGIEDVFQNTLYRMMKSDISPDYAPVVMNLLVSRTPKDVGDVFQCIQDSEAPFGTAIAVTLFHRCEEAGFDLDKLRTFVKTQLLEAETLLQKLRILYLGQCDGPCEMLALLKKFNKWADECVEAISLGHILSFTEARLVNTTREFIHENGALQLFAYICEHVRFGRKERLPEALEALFEDRTVGPFLWLYGRPKTLEECNRSIEKWSLSANNTKLTQRIFINRARPTLTEEIFRNEGAVTAHMAKRLGKETLEQYLERELKIPNLMRYEDTLASAASTLSEQKYTVVGECFDYLLSKVLGHPKLEKQIFDEFISRWPAEETIHEH